MIIDFRLRPPLPGSRDLRIFSSHRDIASQSLADSEVWSLHRRREESRSALQYSLELFFEELDAAGVTHGVVMGRQADDFYGSSNNEEIAEFCDAHSDRFVGFAGVNGSDTNAALKTIEQAGTWQMKGVAFDNGWVGDPPLHQDDDRLWPLYEAAAEAGLIISLTASMFMGPDTSYSHPDRIRRVAERFPDTPIVIPHGCWPWTMLAVGLAIKCANVYLIPDLYLNMECPGAQDYVTGAKDFITEQLLYASSYPTRPIGMSLRQFEGLQLTPEARTAALHKNAQRILGWPGPR